MRCSLRTKYSLIILSIVISIVVVLTTVVLLYVKSTVSKAASSSSEIMERDLLKQMEKRAEILVTFMSEDLINPVYMYDMETIYDITRAAREQKDVVYVYLHDRTGRIIHDGTEENRLLDKRLDDEISRKAVAAQNLIIQRTTNGFFPF